MLTKFIQTINSTIDFRVSNIKIDCKNKVELNTKLNLKYKNNHN